MSKKPTHTIAPKVWISKYADYLFQYALGRMGDEETAKDLVQETFMAAWKAKDSFRGDASEKTWLTSILKRKIVDYFRLKSRKGNPMLMGNFFQDSDEDDRPGYWKENHLLNFAVLPDSHLENEELHDALKACIEKLPNKHLEVFRLKNILEMESEDICKELNISTSNLWVMLHRARINLRECIQNNWFKA